MRVLATAGHVDHGKSTLVRALTGMEPDRWAEERRRGMTIDLGYAWAVLPSGEQLAFVDVPGHQRFIANMLAGLGPAPAVLFVVAADEGWSRQSEEHLAAIDALDVQHGVLAVTRSDLVDPATALEAARSRIARASLGEVDAIAVSGVTGTGLDDLRTALDRLVARMPVPDTTARMRLWIDRSFTVKGSGTVVTGTLETGCIAIGDALELAGRTVSVRGVQSMGRALDRATAVARVAINLRGVAKHEVSRGDVLLTPHAWHHTPVVDARVSTATTLPSELMLHVGSLAVPVNVRRLGGEAGTAVVRLRLPYRLPLQAGDRGVLRDPGRQTVAAGLLVLDADPPPLDRRGAGAARASALATASGTVDALAEVSRRGAMTRAQLRLLGVADLPQSGVRQIGDWLVADETWQGWVDAVEPVLARWAACSPLDPAMPLAAAAHELGVPDAELMTAVAEAAHIPLANGRLRAREASHSLGPAEAGVRTLEDRLRETPFAAPEADELAALGLGRRELAAAQRLARLIRVGDVVLLPSAPDEALRRLRALPQPFTLSDARRALSTTRRVAVPLMEYLDEHKYTERVDAALRRVLD